MQINWLGSIWWEHLSDIKHWNWTVMIHSKDLLIKKQSPIHSQLTQKHLKHVRDYSKLTTETKTTSVTLLWCLYSLFWTYFPPSFRVFVIDSEQVNVSQVTFYAVFYCPQQLPFWIFRKNKNIWNKNTISLKTDLKSSVNLQRFFRRLKKSSRFLKVKLLSEIVTIQVQKLNSS